MNETKVRVTQEMSYLFNVFEFSCVIVIVPTLVSLSTSSIMITSFHVGTLSIPQRPYGLPQGFFTPFLLFGLMGAFAAC